MLYLILKENALKARPVSKRQPENDFVQNKCYYYSLSTFE